MASRTSHRATPRADRFARSIARTLQAIRRERGMTQAEAVRRLAGQGVTLNRSTLSRIELAKADVSMGEVAALCRVYRVNMGYVMLSAELGILLRLEGAHARPSEWLTEEQAAESLGVSVSHLRMLGIDRRGPDIAYARIAIERFKAERR